MPPPLPQRVEYFKGSKLVDALTGPKYKGKLAKDTPIKTRAEAAKLAQELLRVGFIHRSQRFQHAHSRRWELELFNGPFEEDGLFTWVYEGASRAAHTKHHTLSGSFLAADDDEAHTQRRSAHTASQPRRRSHVPHSQSPQQYRRSLRLVLTRSRPRRVLCVCFTSKAPRRSST